MRGLKSFRPTVGARARRVRGGVAERNGGVAPQGVRRRRGIAPARVNVARRASRDPRAHARRVAVASPGARGLTSRSAPTDTADVAIHDPALPSERANSPDTRHSRFRRTAARSVYVGLGDDKRQQLMVRTLDDITARRRSLRRPTRPIRIFSPDGKWVASRPSNQIFKAGIDGTRPQLLGDRAESSEE
jgi:hypothetical protein